MKTTNYLIRIDEPCHEDWNTMQPDAKGKFCSACSKPVFDFSNKSDAEVHAILMAHKEQKICGRFEKTQVNRPLNISIHLSQLPRNISATRAFAIAVFLAFGTLLFSCTTPEGKKIGEVEVVKTADENLILGALSFPVTPVTTDTIKGSGSGSASCVGAPELMGDVVYEEMPAAAEDSIVPSISDIQYTVMGGMRFFVCEPEDSISANPDSSRIQMPAKISEASTLENEAPGLVVYPNPGTGAFTIKYEVLKRANVRIDLFDLNGSWLKTIVDVKEQYEGKYHIPVMLYELPKGIYLVNMINAGERFTQKLVIE